MQAQQPYYVKLLKDFLSLKQRENPHYSLRAFARDVDVHPATLSQVLKGNRALPAKNSAQVLKRLNLSGKEITLFTESFLRHKTSLDKISLQEDDERFILDESHFKIIAEWEYYAVLELFRLDDFEVSSKNIADRLNLTPTRAEVVLENLIQTGLLKMGEDGKLLMIHEEVRTSENIQNLALRQSHKEAMDMGKSKLDDIEVELRDFSSMTAALDINMLPEAKTIIREFRQKMAALLKSGENKTDVYQMAIQFYPLTNVSNKNSRKLS